MKSKKVFFFFENVITNFPPFAAVAADRLFIFPPKLGSRSQHFTVADSPKDIMAAATTFGETTESRFLNVFVKDVSPQKGKGLFANKDFREGELIFEEKPLVCSQFLWNSLYKYTACSSCLKSLETAEQMARRLSGNANLELPYASKCCDITRLGQKIIICHHCQVMY